MLKHSHQRLISQFHHILKLYRNRFYGRHIGLVRIKERIYNCIAEMNSQLFRPHVSEVHGGQLSHFKLEDNKTTKKTAFWTSRSRDMTQLSVKTASHEVRTTDALQPCIT